MTMATQPVGEAKKISQPQGEAGIAQVQGEEGADSTLISRNIRIHDRRTSVRLEPEMWDALREVALLQGVSIHDLCGAIHDMKKPAAPFTGAIRVFLLEFYRAAARTHQQVGMVQKRLDEGRKKRG